MSCAVCTSTLKTTSLKQTSETVSAKCKIEFQAARPPTVNIRQPCAEMLSTGHIGDGNAAVRLEVLRSFVLEAAMHHRQEFVIHLLRHIEAIKVDMHNLRQSLGRAVF